MIVSTMTIGTAIVEIDDAEYAGIGGEALARRWAEVDRAIWAINARLAARQAEREEGSGTAPAAAGD